jgi:hypothetical protein
MGGLDFATSTPIAAALGVIAGTPLLLAALARVPGLRGRNALQFSLVVVAGFAAWLACAKSATAVEAQYGFLLLAAAELLYLEIWGLLSRGYTLGVLATLHAAGTPLSAEDLAARYRGGDGLDWILRHRMGGLVATGLVSASDGRLALTAPGTAVAALYRVAAALLCLRAT